MPYSRIRLWLSRLDPSSSPISLCSFRRLTGIKGPRPGQPLRDYGCPAPHTASLCPQGVGLENRTKRLDQT